MEKDVKKRNLLRVNFNLREDGLETSATVSGFYDIIFKNADKEDLKEMQDQMNKRFHEIGEILNKALTKEIGRM